MDKKKLDNIRNRLDKLDFEFLKIIKKRTKLVNEVIKVKKKKNQIIDNKRIRKVLRNIKIRSIKEKIDPEITKRIWIAMIKSYIEYEKKNFKKR